MRREVESFEAEDKSGGIYYIIKYCTCSSSITNPNQHCKHTEITLITYELIDGTRVEPLGDDVFKLTNDDVLLKKLI